MPTIYQPADLPATRKDGETSTILANPALLGSSALHVERIELGAAAKTSSFEAADAERFMYVIRGGGQSEAGGQKYPLEPESVLWLEREDTFHLEAGAQGLEVLLCRAPGSR